MCILCGQFKARHENNVVAGKSAGSNVSGLPSGGASSTLKASAVDSFSFMGTPLVNGKTEITYTFSSLSGHQDELGVSFALFNADQKNAAISAMNSFENVANINFSEASNPSSNNINFRQAELGAGVAGYAYFPINNVSDVVIDLAYNSYSGSDSVGLAPGKYGYLTILHEIGHALGLDHSNELSNFDDSLNATIMSYRDSDSTTLGGLAAEGLDQYAPRTPQIYDIYTLQQKYGANTSYNSGNSTYSLTGAKDVETIWDGGGTDKISAKNLAFGATIDLREGVEYISNYNGTYFWNAFGANIENAEGGAGDDTINGNSLANTITGGTGNDEISGHEGADFIGGNKGDDVILGGTGNDTLQAGQGDDIVQGQSGDDSVVGGMGADTLLGGDGNDVVRGGKGNDILFGNDGNDSLTGGTGNDSLVGNAGSDYYFFSAGFGADSVSGFTHGQDKLVFSADVFTTANEVILRETISGQYLHNSL
jgi:serralysin